MKLDRLVKVLLVQCDNGEEMLCRQFDGGNCWDLVLADDCMIKATECYDLAKDIFEMDVAKDIATITFFINKEPKFTVDRTTTREVFLEKCIGDRPITEFFD